MEKVLTAKIDGKGMDNNEIVSSILEQRGISDLTRFLKPTEDDMVPFEEMIGLHEAYQMIDDAITMGDRFLVLADVDVDGCSANAIIVKYLQACGAEVNYVINKGKKHGAEDFDLTLLDGVDVMIIVDSIDNNPEVYKRILDTGTKLCVLDHHLVERRLLNADLDFVLVSSANYYPNSELSGAGVVLKLALYMDYMNLTDYVNECGLWLYGALGIVADMCSMESRENRYIVHKGLEYYKNPLVKKMVGGYSFDSTAISFSVAPLINACMRTSNNETAMNVFLTDDESAIGSLVNQMKGYKEEQNKVVDELMQLLLPQAENQMNQKCMFFMLPSEIDADVTGLIGNKLLSEYNRPLCVLREKIEVNNETGEILKHEMAGSMRGIGVDSFKDYIDETGIGWCSGHPNAAGLGIPAAEYEYFKTALEQSLQDVELKVEVEADIELEASQINEQLIKQLTSLNRLSGSGFAPIKVLVRTNDYEVSTFSTRKHLKVVDKSGLLIVKWNTNDWQTMKNDKQLVAIGTLSSPRYGRSQYLQLTADEYTQQND